jgi:hypothetical protein
MSDTTATDHHSDMDRVRRGLMSVLVTAYPAVLHRSEIVRELDEPIHAEDTLEQFRREGLVHCIDSDFFLATRTTIAAYDVSD